MKAKDNLNDKSSDAKTREHLMKQVGNLFKTDVSKCYFLSGNFCYRKFWKQAAPADSERD